jgi:hypothetical protein
MAEHEYKITQIFSVLLKLYISNQYLLSYSKTTMPFHNLNRTDSAASAILKQECSCIRFVVFTAVTMKNAVFLNITQFGFCKNQRFEGTYRLHRQDDKNR